MATYEYNGKTLEAPDGTSPEHLLEAFKQMEQQDVANQVPRTPDELLPSEQGASSPVSIPSDAGFDPKTLHKNKDWLDASRITYKKNNGLDFQGSDADLAEYGLDQMGWFNYNLPRMAVDAKRIQDASPEEKKAFLTLIDMYDKTGISWGGFGRFIKGAALDPTTYVGLGSFGLGAISGQATKLASKEALKEMLRYGIQVGIDGAIQGATTNLITQQAKVNAGGQDGIHIGEAALSTVLGATVGGALGAGGTAATIGLRKEVQAAARGATKEEPGIAKDELLKVMEEKANGVPNPEAKPATAEVKPVGDAPSGNEVLDAIKTLAESGRPRENTPDFVLEGVTAAKNLLLNLPEGQLKKSLLELRDATVDKTEREYLDRTIKSAYETMEAKAYLSFDELQRVTETDPAGVEKHVAHSQLRSIADALKDVDKELSSPLGSSLAQRVGGLNTNEFREITPETYLRAANKTPESASAEDWAAAHARYYEDISKWAQRGIASEEVQKLEKGIKDAYDGNDIGTAMQLTGERNAKLASIMDQEQQQAGVVRKSANLLLKGLNEFVISTVLTSSTLAANTIPSVMKTLYRPALDAVVTGLDEAALRRMSSTYSTLGTSMGVAFRAAKLAFDMEKSLLRTDGGKYLEQAPVIPGVAGRYLRVVPRLLEATDEFFSQMNYRAFVQGEATFNAINAANEKGLTGKAKEDFVKQAVEKAHKQSFSPDIDVVDVLDSLRQTGLNKGLSGDKLTEWVKAQLDGNKDLFKDAINQAGRKFSDDLLFKREFSGDNWASRLAQSYEREVNKNPWMRLVGQLFFRTPVRVFEEGFRLTAGLNMLSGTVIPGTFIKDLRGGNGPQAQIRAQGEAMLSFGIASAVMIMYANGAITSGGPSDSKINREAQAANHDQYVVKFGDHKFDFKNMDPFSTPMKIVANLLDKYHEAVYREAQGDPKPDEAKVASAIAIALLPVAKAVADANLVEGLTQGMQFGSDLMDTEKNESALEGWIGKKLQLAYPSMLNKVTTQVSPELTDPRTISQYFWSKINPSDPLVPKKYDALGYPMENDHPMGMLTGIKYWKDTNDPKARRQMVNDELYKISLATDAKFIVPYKMDFPGLQGIDLRTKTTADGKTTLYDRFMEYYRAQKPEEQLYPVLGVGSYGTKRYDGTKVQMVHSILKPLRDAAMYRLMSEETGVHQSFIENFINKGEALSGKRDVRSFPYQ